MVFKDEQNQSAAKKTGGKFHAPGTMRVLVGGLRLLAGALIVFASLTLAMYAGRVEAVSPSGSALHLPPLLAWLPWLALAFLGLFLLANRVFHDRSDGNRHRPADIACENDGETAVMFTQPADDSWRGSTGWNEPLAPEHFPAAVERHFHNCKKQSSFIALSVVAIDNFEPLADAIGQVAIEERLQQTALSLHSLVRSQGGIFAGPQESGRGHYLVLLPNTDPDEALQASEDLRMAVEDLGYDNPVPPGRTMTASLGLAVMVPDDRVAQSALFSAADHALERSQREGGNRVEVEMIDSRPEK